jgi:hypothetical protein
VANLGYLRRLRRSQRRTIARIAADFTVEKILLLVNLSDGGHLGTSHERGVTDHEARLAVQEILATLGVGCFAGLGRGETRTIAFAISRETPIEILIMQYRRNLAGLLSGQSETSAGTR